MRQRGLGVLRAHSLGRQRAARRTSPHDGAQRHSAGGLGSTSPEEARLWLGKSLPAARVIGQIGAGLAAPGGRPAGAPPLSVAVVHRCRFGHPSRGRSAVMRRTQHQGGMMSDPQRPRYHFLPPSDWMNDPTASFSGPDAITCSTSSRRECSQDFPIRARPCGARIGAMRSATIWSTGSTCPLRWRRPPVGRIQPGAISGCAVDHDGVPTLIYTGVMPQKACIASSADDLITWTKHPANPVIPAPPVGWRRQAGVITACAGRRWLVPGDRLRRSRRRRRPAPLSVAGPGAVGVPRVDVHG